jgi:transposase
MIVSGRSPLMPAAKPPEFRRSAMEPARLREQPIAKIAKDLVIGESCLRRWMDQADLDEGLTEGLSGDERAELVRLRREVRVKEMEIEILKRERLLHPGERATK